jgi:hypothetical protein
MAEAVSGLIEFDGHFGVSWVKGFAEGVSLTSDQS